MEEQLFKWVEIGERGIVMTDKQSNLETSQGHAAAATTCPNCKSKSKYFRRVLGEKKGISYLCEHTWHDTLADSAPAGPFSCDICGRSHKTLMAVQLCCNDSAPAAADIAAQPSHEGSGPAAGGGDTKDEAEAFYWEFDARRKGYALWKGHPQAERDALKLILRSVMRQRDEAIRERDAKDAQVTKLYAQFDAALREAEALRRGEFICKKCGLRKDADTIEEDF
jgi:hypothetical protein